MLGTVIDNEPFREERRVPPNTVLVTAGSGAGEKVPVSAQTFGSVGRDRKVHQQI